MLKSIATACSECIAKHGNKASYNTDYIALTWLTSLVMIEKKSKCRLKKEIFIIVKNTVLTKNWFVVSNFWELPKYHTEKCSGHLYFSLKIKVEFTTFRTFQLQSTWDRLIKQIFCTETTSTSLFWVGMFSDWLKALL